MTDEASMFGSDNEENSKEVKLTINKEYAKKFHKFKECQELDRLKQKYGEEALNGEEDESSSESEDDDAEGLTPDIEKDFLKTLSMIKAKDPKIYEAESVFYASKETAKAKEEDKSKKSKAPVFLKDYERQRLLEKGEKAYLSDSDDDESGRIGFLEAKDPSELTYNEEQKLLKESFKNIQAADEDDDDFLKPRIKTEEEKKAEEADYDNWVKDEGAQISEDEKKHINALSRYWKDDELDEGERFLKDYILKKKYIDTESYKIPTYKEVVTSLDDTDEEEDEEHLEKEEEFEKKFNFRFEEPDQEFIKSYPRTIAESVRRKDDRRTEKRKERDERKAKEKDKKMQELKRLKNLKRKEIMEKIDKLKAITGNDKIGFLEDDIGDDFDASKYDKIMQSVFDNEYYDAENEEDAEKPVFSDEEEDYPMHEENWDEWEGAADDAYDEMYEPHCEDPEFNMDADYDPNAAAIQNGHGLEGSSKGKKRSKFSQALNQKKPVFDPNEKTFEEYFDEYYKLDYEDIVGDLPVRFKYREVVSNNYGLSVDEILQAEDRELNEWCSLKKATRYNTEEEEKKDRQRYKKKGRNKKKKAQVLTSVYTKDEKVDTSNEDTKGEKVDTSNEDTSIPTSSTDQVSSTSSTSKDSSQISRKKIPIIKRDRAQLFKSRFQSRLSSASKNKAANFAENIKRKKLLQKHFRGANIGQAQKLSAQRLAAYGLDKRKKKKE